MKKFINAITHTEMWVADERVDEYIEAGHAPVSDAPVAIEPEKKSVNVEKKPATKTATKSTKKATTKKG